MKIDRNVPMPTAKTAKPAKQRIPVENMEIGDSIFLPGVKRQPAVSSARATAMKAGLSYNFKSANENDGVRIWRVA